jgi:nucleoside phosphorylase
MSTVRPPEGYEVRKELARMLLSEGIEPVDLAPELPRGAMLAGLPAALTVDLNIPYPDHAPVPRPLVEEPRSSAALPQADVLVVTWTVAEQNALADVLTPGFGRSAWYRYRRRFDEAYASQIREGAPAFISRRLGSYFCTDIGARSVVCFKSELHLNQDGKPTGEKTATLPVKDLFHQLITEVRPGLVITVGTAGGVHLDQSLGDVVVTRSAKFRLGDEFENEPFNGKVYRSDFTLPTAFVGEADKLARRFKNRLVEPLFAPPTKRFAGFTGAPIQARENQPTIWLDGGNRELDKVASLPILTTDFFEYGTSANQLWKEGCSVEMGDAVLGLVCGELSDPPDWVVVRNVSDPQINADLPTEPRAFNMQTHWAVWYYEKYGYWTSVNSALATWALVAGLND